MNSTEKGAISETQDFFSIFYYSSVACTVLSIIAFVVNLYLIICSRYLRRPIGINLRLCVSLSVFDALAAFCYILTYCINVILPIKISNCWSLLLEVLKFATFFASVSTLLILALNHYIGIVYPLRRHVITSSRVRITIILSYILPFLLFFALFCIVPGGFRAKEAFGFFSEAGCNSTRILQTPIVRSVIVGPFIVFILLISFLYGHVMYHMSRTGKDPLLSHYKNKRKYNAKLLSTLALLAGSALIGWLPTTVLFALICAECIFPVAGPILVYITVLTHFLNIFKLIFDALIYASRLIEIRFAMWEFHNKVIASFDGIFGIKRIRRNVPQEFLKYLNDTTRSVKSKKVIENSSVVTLGRYHAKKSLTSMNSGSRKTQCSGRTSMKDGQLDLPVTYVPGKKVDFQADELCTPIEV